MRRLYLENWLGDRGYDVYRLISERTYARRAALREWLRDNGYDPDQILVFEDSSVQPGTSAERLTSTQSMPVCVCGLRIWKRTQRVWPMKQLPGKAKEVTLASGHSDTHSGKADLARWQDRRSL